MFVSKTIEKNEKKWHDEVIDINYTVRINNQL